jgi:hypothetical protein
MQWEPNQEALQVENRNIDGRSTGCFLTYATAKRCYFEARENSLEEIQFFLSSYSPPPHTVYFPYPSLTMQPYHWKLREEEGCSQDDNKKASNIFPLRMRAIG